MRHDADVAYLGERVCGGHFNPSSSSSSSSGGLGEDYSERWRPGW
jgi:hypothetical protein